MGAVDVISFGCRLNAFESDIIAAQAEQAGLADAVIVNSCAVTSEAVAQTRQAIRKLRRSNKDARVVVTGCAAQIDPHMFGAMDEVDHVIGNAEKMQPAIWRQLSTAAAGGRRVAEKIAVSDVMAAGALSLPAGVSPTARPRAYVQVQNGCDHRCTFCIIPFGRGNARSLPINGVVDQVRARLETGNSEIVLTGVDLTGYGGDLSGAPGLGKLVKTLLRELPELKRLRLSSIDSVEADADLLDVIASDERLMPHLHLSLQSGDDLILKRMKRRHSRGDALAFCMQVRRLRPDVALGADLIAGFPTETEEMFVRSLDLIQQCGLTFVHAFPFSPRQGTPAARMPQVAHEVVKDRASRLRAAADGALQRRLATEIGRERTVLIESARQGRTEHFLPVAITGERPGDVRRLRISAQDGKQLIVNSSS